LGSGLVKNTLVGLAMHSVAKLPHAKQRKYLNSLFVA
jgi:hypothetical protein